MVGGGRPLLREILGQPTPVGEKSPILNQWASVVSHLLLLLNCASTPSTALDASVISDIVRIEVTGASVSTLSALGWTTATLY